MDNGDIDEQKLYDEFTYPLVEGDTWYLIDKKWVESWKKHIGIFETTQNESPGPIDNSSFFEKGTNKLSDHLMEDIDYCMVPEKVGKKLEEIYGLVDGQQSITRKVIEIGTYSKQTIVEVYPPEIRLRQHGKTEEIKETFSRSQTIDEVHKRMKKLFEVPPDSTSRVYIKDSLDDLKDKNTLDEAGVGPTQILVLELQNQDGTWPRSSGSQSSSKEAMSSSSSITRKISPGSSYSSNGYSTRSSSNFYSTRIEQPGLCGLSNLGNTCFMNSAIQCLSNVPYLTFYFLQNKYKAELNPDNPLGMHGKLAKAYAVLVQDIWSGKHSSVSPRDFKYNVGSFAPRFSGYQQHDSQELLAFLIDGLHEDLNRIKKKPYIELKDSGGRPDEEVAAEAWNNHRQRNDSIIIDTFHGLFKSTLVCPDCDRISITFDPFGFLSLPLPSNKELSLPCTFVPKDPTKPVEKHAVSVPKNCTMKIVLETLADKVGCSARELVICDVHSYKFYKVYQSRDKIGLYPDRDNLFVYQVEEPEDGRSEPECAKVLMRRTGRLGPQFFAHPFMIPVKSGVTTYRKFYNAVLKAVSRYIKEESREDVKMLSELKKIEINETDVDAIQENGQKEAEEETRLFQLVTLTSFGTNTKELKDNDKPIIFTRDTYFAADWNEDQCQEYLVDDWSASPHVRAFSSSMNLQREKGIALQDCMKLFTTKEKLGEDDPWYCPSCKDHKQATKKFDLWALPPVLIIHLKRFSYSRWSRDKIGTMVEFPLRDLDLSEFIINPEKEKWPIKKKRYNLIGVSNHYGGLGGGHYTAYARNYVDDQWYYYDDTSVTKSSENQVQTKAAYMLMYQRQDMEDWVNQTKSGVQENFSFLKSMVSPRGLPVQGFSYDGLTTDIQLSKKSLLNGNDDYSEGDYNGREMTEMDTS